MSPTAAEDRAAKTDNDFPGPDAAVDKVVQPAVTDAAIGEFDKTRPIRHEIVHRGRRITHLERGRARQAVDTGRWLFNQLENKPERAQLREHGGALKSTGRTALAPRFPTTLTTDGITVHPSGGDGASTLTPR